MSSYFTNDISTWGWDIACPCPDSISTSKALSAINSCGDGLNTGTFGLSSGESSSVPDGYCYKYQNAWCDEPTVSINLGELSEKIKEAVENALGDKQRGNGPVMVEKYRIKHK